MASESERKLEQRVVRAAEAALARQKFVTAIDVFVGIGWLPPSLVSEWRQGRVDYLERVLTANLSKVSMAMRVFRRWARNRVLNPSETEYVSRTRDRRALRFSKSGDPDIELAYRTHWVSPALSEAKRERLAEKQSKPPELVVIWALNEWQCAKCGGGGQLLMMAESAPLCLTCAKLDHLVYLPAGDATLTRRAKQASELSAVVVRFSRSRGRYEREGVLVEAAALARVEKEPQSGDGSRGRATEQETDERALPDAERVLEDRRKA